MRRCVLAKSKSQRFVLPEERPFTEEQIRELSEKPIEDIREILNALDAWRKNSLTSSIRI